MRILGALLITAGFGTSGLAVAQNEPPSTPPAAASAPAAEDPVHNELRAVFRGLIDSIETWNPDRLVTFLHPDVVVTWADATVSKGRDGVKNYLVQKTSGPGHIVESFKTQANVDELTRLYASGSVGVAFGTSNDHFRLTNGIDVQFPSRWTATLAKENGQWLITSLHSSVDMFDNPLLAGARKMALYAGIAAAVGGLILGVFAGRLFKRGQPGSGR